MYMLESDLPLYMIDIYDFFRRCVYVDFFLFVYYLEDPLSCRSRRLQLVRNVCDLSDRLVETSHILNERLDVAYRDLSVYRKISA